MVAPTNIVEEDDVGALIYREVQLRKAEAAAAAAESKKEQFVSTSTHNSHVENSDGKSLPSPKHTGASIEKHQSMLEGNDLPKEKVAKKKYRYECSADGCTNQVKQGGVCIRHGAKVKRMECSVDKCTNPVQKGGVCTEHGAKHGAKRKLCSSSSEGCTNNYVQKGGVSVRYGARTRILCNMEGCNKIAQRKGVCWRHGAKHLAKRKLCSSEGCKNYAKTGGVCIRHGATVNRSKDKKE